jgi:transposase-like protein
MSTQKRHKMRKKVSIRYSEPFKLRIIKEIEEGEESILSLSNKYGIKGSHTVKNWLKRYGRNDLLSKKVIIMNANEQIKEKELKERIKQLETAVVNLELERMESEAYFLVACKELGKHPEEFKKKGKSKGC